jgi:hypothetical protein
LYLSAAPSEASTFSFVTFSLYVDTMALFFKFYTFVSVLEYDVCFRKWRRANSLGWDAHNPHLKDCYLRPKPQPPLGPFPQTRKVPSGSTLRCNDFQRGMCTRNNCRYLHNCALCHTTWPSPHRACMCKNGAFPPSVILPPGVTAGQ